MTVYSPYGENLKQITDLGAFTSSPKWSPNGKYIVFVSGSGIGDNTTFEIYSVGINDNKTQQLTENSFHDSNPIWSSNGSKIIFQSSTDDNVDIYMIDFDDN